MTQKEFLQNGLVFLQTPGLFPLGTDAMVLADFARPPAGSAVCDLCAGSGAVGLLMLSHDPSLRVTALELQRSACAAAEENRRENRLEDRFSVLCGDLRQIRSLLAPGSFRHVVCNPPYFPVDGGLPDREEAFALARTELACDLDDVCRAAAWLLPAKGCFYLVHRPQRLTDVMVCLRRAGLEPKVLRLVHHRQTDAPSLLLVKAVRGGRPGLDCLPPLILRDADGAPSAEYRRIYGTDGSAPA